MSSSHRWPWRDTATASATATSTAAGRRSRRAADSSRARRASSGPRSRGCHPAGVSTGSTKRVTVTAVSSPAIENTDSWASPGKPENSSATKPATEVSTPSRMVAQNARAGTGSGLAMRTRWYSA